jgi:hypothetical protein
MFPSAFRFGVSANDEFLLQVELDFDPCSGAFSGLISGTAAFANQAFKSQFPSFAQKLFDVFCERDSLPRWMRSAHFYEVGDLDENRTGPEWTKFLKDLNTRCQQPRVPFMVADLPEHFVPRPEEFDRLCTWLLDKEREEPIAITAALRGAGGYGKTTLAKALCHNPAIQDRLYLRQTCGPIPVRQQHLTMVFSG